MDGHDQAQASTDQIEVAVLFTDIEGSTAKWEDDPVAMRRELARHDEVVVESVVGCGGRIVKSTGDGVLARFEDAASAVGAAVVLQLGLARLDFSAVGGIRVRVGIDVGLAEDRAGDLYGPTLNRCARVTNAAHGGQVLVTERVESRLRTARPDSLELLDLGLHRLRGVTRPERLYQIVHPGLDAVFPPLRSLNAALGNLPVVSGDLLGRRELLGRVRDLLTSPGLVTLVGPGGVGKTSLAIHVGRAVTGHFPDGVWFADLAEVDDPDDVADAVARSMGVARRPAQPLTATLRDVLSARQALVILDNAEHVAVGARELVSQVMVHGSPSRLLATSRIGLGARAETVVRIEPLTPPPLGTVTVSEARSWPAVELFFERAHRTDDQVPPSDEEVAAVVDICNRLDGLPLAIELAAARTELLTIDQISSLLADRFRLLNAGHQQDPRRRTLAAAVDWSFEHLSDEAQRLFTRLGTVSSSFGLDTAATLAEVDELDAVDRIGELVHDSMVTAEAGHAGVRYRLLETMRDYASARLEASGAAEEVHGRHAELFGGVAADLHSTMWDHDALALVDRCRTELPDLQRAFEFQLARDPARALAIPTDLYALWLIRDLAADGRRWLDQAIEAVGGVDAEAPMPLLVRALDDAGTLAWVIGELGQAEGYLCGALAVAQRLGLPAPAKALVRLGSIRVVSGDVQEGRRLCQLARDSAALDDTETVLVVERTLGAVLALSGEPEEGAVICKQAVARARDTDLWLASALTNLAFATFGIDPSTAAEASIEALEESRRIGSKFYEGSAWGGLGAARMKLGDREGGCRAYAEAMSHMLDAGARSNVLVSMDRLSEQLVDPAPEVAVVLVSGVAGQQRGPGSDGTWRDVRYEALRARLADRLGRDNFEDLWHRGETMTLDAMVPLARMTVDEVWPAPAP